LTRASVSSSSTTAAARNSISMLALRAGRRVGYSRAHSDRIRMNPGYKIAPRV
jgi:hypothetical protein